MYACAKRVPFMPFIVSVCGHDLITVLLKQRRDVRARARKAQLQQLLALQAVGLLGKRR